MSRAQHSVCEIIPCVDEVSQPLSFCPSDHPASHSPSLFMTLSPWRYSLREDAAETLIPFPPEYPFPCLISPLFFCHSLSRAWEQPVWGSLHAFSYLNPGFLPSLPWCYFPSHVQHHKCSNLFAPCLSIMRSVEHLGCFTIMCLSHVDD